MGYKAVKEHYRIEHMVQVTDEGICIGSSCIHDIIVVGLNGAMKKRYDSKSNDDLVRYQREMDADPATLKKLIAMPDTFDKAITVYTYDGGEIMEALCEELAWPNVTHDGRMMFDNQFSADKAQVIRWAKRSADSAIRYTREHVQQIEQQLADTRARMAQYEADLAKLEALYPDVQSEAAI